MEYKAILFSPDGEFVTDFKSDSVQDVWEKVCDMGSKWIFYPIVFVATDKTISDCPEGLEHLKGKRIKTIQEHIKKQWDLNKDEICEVINSGMPLFLIY
jgi:hypothetical protein